MDLLSHVITMSNTFMSWVHGNTLNTWIHIDYLDTYWIPGYTLTTWAQIEYLGTYIIHIDLLQDYINDYHCVAGFHMQFKRTSKMKYLSVCLSVFLCVWLCDCLCDWLCDCPSNDTIVTTARFDDVTLVPVLLRHPGTVKWPTTMRWPFPKLRITRVEHLANGQLVHGLQLDWFNGAVV